MKMLCFRLLLQAIVLIACVLGIGKVHAKIEAFALSDVRLLDTSHQIRYERLNAHYLLEMLEPDRLLWSFRKTAGLPTPGIPYIASWEDPGCELRGHFVGHYLSALSLAYASTGKPRHGLTHPLPYFSRPRSPRPTSDTPHPMASVPTVFTAG